MNKHYIIHWILVVSTIMWSHLSRTCIVGFCSDELVMGFFPTVASTVFTFAVASFMAEFELCGDLVNKFPMFMRIILDVLIYLLVSNVALRLLWIPYTRGFSECCTFLDKTLKSSSIHALKWIPKHISPKTTHEVMDVVVALSLYLLYLYATEMIETWKETINEALYKVMLHAWDFPPTTLSLKT